MVNILFVCLGNICRSPMAEAIFRHLVIQEGLEGKIHIDSAGTGDWHIGHPPHKGTQGILTENCISFEGQCARQISKEDFSRFDYIVAMDGKNIQDLKLVSKGEECKFVGRLADFVDHEEWGDVPDPYFTGNFQEVYEIVTEGCQALLSYIRKQEKI